jgi:hypothetical protein
VYTLWTEFNKSNVKTKKSKGFPACQVSVFEFCLLHHDFIYIAANRLPLFIRKTMHNFTPEDLLLYLYKEVTPQQSAAIEEALKMDWTLREKLAVLKTSMERLNSLTVAPRTEVVLNVLKYAATQQTVKTS